MKYIYLTGIFIIGYFIIIQKYDPTFLVTQSNNENGIYVANSFNRTYYKECISLSIQTNKLTNIMIYKDNIIVKKCYSISCNYDDLDNYHNYTINILSNNDFNLYIIEKYCNTDLFTILYFMLSILCLVILLFFCSL